MSSPFDSRASYPLLNECDNTNKKIKDWYGEDCLEWASRTERELNISFSSLVHIDRFQKVTGRDLLKFKVSEFKKLVNDDYGPLFFQAFRKLVKERREEKAHGHSPNFSHPINVEASYNSEPRTVPQIYLNELQISQDDFGLGRISPALCPPFSQAEYQEQFRESPLIPSYHFGDPQVPLKISSSPVMFHSFPQDSYRNPYSDNYPPASPTFHNSDYKITNLSGAVSEILSLPYGYEDSQAIYNEGPLATSPSFVGSGNDFKERKLSNSTYFAQPFILSGGSFSYGHSNNSNNNLSYFDEPISSIPDGAQPISDSEGYSSILPDFSSLMINSGVDNIAGNLDILELENSLTEDFSDFDQYIHSEDSGSNESGDGTNFSNDILPDMPLESSVSMENDGTLEDCMLKKITTGKRGNRVRHPQSWEFLVRLLLNPKSNPSLIKWEDKERGIFRLVQKEEIAKLWGKRSEKHKNEPLAYDNFARILRYHYKRKVLVPVSDKHLVYKLGDKVLANMRSQGLL